MALLLAACGSSSKVVPGTPVITMSATNAGYSSYAINIDQITLTRNDNTVVTPLFTPETVDLASLADFTELVEAPAVPVGTYISATLVLDYTTANIWYQVNGHAIPVVAYGQAGSALTGQTVLTVTFDKANPLVVTNAKSNRVNINFDLAAFNTVTSVANPGAIVVRPFATVSPVTVDYRPIRARGIYVVNQSGNFIVNIRPFFDLTSALGGLQVNVNDQTYYNVSQQAFTGAPGFAALGTLAISQPIAAFGTLGSLDAITPQFNATQVYGGPSQESLAQDHVAGTIAARSGGTLTVRGAAIHPGLGNVFGFPEYGDSYSVIVDATTVVSEDGQNVSGLSDQSLSIGQRIDAAGLSILNSSGAATGIDTRNGGQVRMASTPAWGNLVSASAGSATLDLITLNNFAPAGLTFAGTASGGGAVDPALYPVNTGAATAVGPVVLAQGFVTAFGGAPPAFNAQSVTAADAYPQQQLIVEWQNGGAAAPFLSQSAAGLVVDLANPDLTNTHGIVTGPTAINLKDLPASPLITTTGANAQALTLAVGNSTLTSGVSVYNSAASFSAGLAATLNGTHKVYKLVAVGQYDAATNTFVAQNIDVALWE
ncbi:MAG TPA: DUF4382 domain-containing protein [Steroidobacteraceae bacterium]|nr:DUF4382 domain-containing protein [Steroidobacteraceae bacterium]